MIPERITKETIWSDRGQDYDVWMTFEWRGRYEPVGVKISVLGEPYLIDSQTMRRFPWGRIRDELWPKVEVT